MVSAVGAHRTYGGLLPAESAPTPRASQRISRRVIAVARFSEPALAAAGGEGFQAQTNIKELPLLFRGKVRDVYDLGDALLVVASDRLSAFDVVLPTPIPDKGRVLTALSTFWFERTRHIVACRKRIRQEHRVDAPGVGRGPRERVRRADLQRLAARRERHRDSRETMHDERILPAFPGAR